MTQPYPEPLDFLVYLLYFLVEEKGANVRTATDRPPWVPHDMYPFESRYVDIDGSCVHYIDEGDGPTLLFLHGNPTWSFLYRNIVLGLRDSFRCVALDYPGFGLSSASEGYDFTPAAHAGVVGSFVARLDLNDVTLMGQDWGGPIGLHVAASDPDRFAGFVLGNTWAWPLNGIFHFEVFSRILGSSIVRVLIRNANAFVNVMIPLGTRTHLPADVMRAYREPFAQKERRRPTWQLPRELLRSKSFMEDLEVLLPQVTDLPTLLVWGGSDFALRTKVELPLFEGLFVNHRTVVLPKAKHFFQEDAPADVAKAIRDWYGTGTR
jgi:haloalkane dehalogenase